MAKRRILVYVSGPISRGDLRANLKQACDAGLEIIRAGYSAIIPHLTCFVGLRLGEDGYQAESLPAGIPVEDWYGVDVEIVRRCDAVLRLPGESDGADLETREADKLGIPVFESLPELLYVLAS